MLAEFQINAILNDMMGELNGEQLRKLKCSIIMRTSETCLRYYLSIFQDGIKSDYIKYA